MATVRNRVGSENDEILSLHELFRVVGDQMTDSDVRMLKILCKDVLSHELRSKIHDGFTFLLALEKKKRLDESNFKYLFDLLKIITRHDLTQYLTLRKRRPVVYDPVDSYLESRFKSRVIIPFSRKRPNPSNNQQPTTTTSNNATASANSDKPEKQPVFESVQSDQTEAMNTPQTERHNKTLEELEMNQTHVDHPLMNYPPDESSWIPPTKRRKSDRLRKKPAETEEPKEEVPSKKITCDIRLRVRAEYCDHQSVLQGNVFSNKPTPTEQQFEKFLQANTILKSRDLGSIHCDIKFSELTYLDAFWRDYVNGALLEALKGVFITESLKQAVGHEAIKLLVNVDEDDYNNGRLKLLQNLVARHKSS